MIEKERYRGGIKEKYVKKRKKWMKNLFLRL